MDCAVLTRFNQARKEVIKASPPPYPATTIFAFGILTSLHNNFCPNFEISVTVSSRQNCMKRRTIFLFLRSASHESRFTSSSIDEHRSNTNPMIARRAIVLVSSTFNNNSLVNPGTVSLIGTDCTDSSVFSLFIFGIAASCNSSSFDSKTAHNVFLTEIAAKRASSKQGCGALYNSNIAEVGHTSSSGRSSALPVHNSFNWLTIPDRHSTRPFVCGVVTKLAIDGIGSFSSSSSSSFFFLLPLPRFLLDIFLNILVQNEL